MSIQIIDASVAIKWFVDEKEGKEEAFSILTAIENEPKNFGVPELFFNEMLAVFCKLSIEEKLIQEYIDCLEQVGFFRIGNGKELLGAAAHLATRYKISGYDAIYAASAQLAGGKWVTFDRVAHNRIKSLKISQLVGAV